MKRSILGLAAIAGLTALALAAGRISAASAFPTPNDENGHDHVAGIVTDDEA